MFASFTDALARYFELYGYWTLAVMLLLENAGIPVPGETTLIAASFLARSRHTLEFWPIVIVAVTAATIGDNIGYAIGYWGGRPLLDRYKHIFRIEAATVVRSEQIFAKYGPATVFVARFITGLRVVAGPLAGVLRVPWRVFLAANFAGAVVWVLTFASLGYFAGSQAARLMQFVDEAGIVLLVIGVVLAIVWWMRRRASSTSPGPEP